MFQNSDSFPGPSLPILLAETLDEAEGVSTAPVFGARGPEREERGPDATLYIQNIPMNLKDFALETQIAQHLSSSRPANRV